MRRRTSLAVKAARSSSTMLDSWIALIIRDKGVAKRQRRLLCGAVDKYTVVDLGLEPRTSSKRLARSVSPGPVGTTRKSIQRSSKLKSWHGTTRACAIGRSPTASRFARACGSASSRIRFQALLPTLAERTRFLAELQRNGVNAVFHAHVLPIARRPRPGSALAATSR